MGCFGFGGFRLKENKSWCFEFKWGEGLKGLEKGYVGKGRCGLNGN